MRGGKLRVENFIDEDLEVAEGGYSTCGKIISTNSGWKISSTCDRVIVQMYQIYQYTNIQIYQRYS